MADLRSAAPCGPGTKRRNPRCHGVEQPPPRWRPPEDSSSGNGAALTSRPNAPPRLLAHGPSAVNRRTAHTVSPAATTVISRNGEERGLTARVLAASTLTDAHPAGLRLRPPDASRQRPGSMAGPSRNHKPRQRCTPINGTRFRLTSQQPLPLKRQRIGQIGWSAGYCTSSAVRSGEWRVFTGTVACCSGNASTIVR